MHENFTTCNRYIPSSTRNVSLDLYQDIRFQNGVSMGRLIPHTRRNEGCLRLREQLDFESFRTYATNYSV
jgi:hypothetical protein